MHFKINTITISALVAYLSPFLTQGRVLNGNLDEVIIANTKRGENKTVMYLPN